MIIKKYDIIKMVFVNKKPALRPVCLKSTETIIFPVFLLVIFPNPTGPTIFVPTQLLPLQHVLKHGMD